MTAVVDRRGARIVTLCVAVAAAPAAWMAHLLVSYLLVPVACRQGSDLLLHVTTVVTALAAAGGGAVALRTWKRARSRARGTAFVALAGAFMSPLFLIVILVGGVGPLLIRTCAG